MPPSLSRPANILAALITVLALCSLVYYPGLDGGFIFDDFPNIVENQRLQVEEPSAEGLRQAALSSDSGTLRRPVSMISFWLNYYMTGLDPFFFKLSNLLIHLLNGLGLFWLTRLILEEARLGVDEKSRDWVALAVAAIWLVHPLNLTSVLYIVQRMTSLSAMFVIFGLIGYVLGRKRLTQGVRGFPLILATFAVFGLLAVLSKETGALLPLYAAVLELTLFRFASLQPAASRKLKVFFLLTVAVPLVAVVAFVLSNPEWIDAQYQVRPFSLEERLMTEARVLWLYMCWALVPARGELGLFHDDLVLSSGLLEPATTLLSIAGIALMVIAALNWRKRAPVFAFAIFWYFAGHLLESSFIALELVHEHRNYLPVFGLIFGAVFAITSSKALVSLASARVLLPAAFALMLAIVTAIRSLDWSDPNSLRLSLAYHHPQSARSNHEAGIALGTLALVHEVLAPVYYSQTKAYFERSTALDPNGVAGLFSLILLEARSGGDIGAPLEELRRRLATIPLNITVIGGFRSLVDWVTKQEITISQDDVQSLFDAALGNGSAHGRTRAVLFSTLSSYRYNVVGDTQEAVSLAMIAVQEDPSEPAHRVSLADLAIKLGNFELAERALGAAREADKLGRFTLQIRGLAESIPKSLVTEHR